MGPVGRVDLSHRHAETGRHIDLLRLVCRLSPDVRVVYHAEHSYLVRDQPLRVFRLKRAALPLVERCASGCTLADVVTSARSLSEETSVAIVDRLVAAGFATLTGPSLDDSPPRVSVVIPVRNRPEAISRCLMSLTKLQYPADRIEIIVVDDASSDTTPEVVRQLIAEMSVKFVRIPAHKGQAHCRNVGAQRAEGEILAFIDSDCLADPRWLVDLVPEFADPRVAAVGGAVGAITDRHWLQRYEAVRSPLYQGTQPAVVRPRTSVSYVPACNLLVRRREFLEAGGFVIDRGEEVDLIWRLCEQGLAVHYLPTGRVLHDHRYQIGNFVTRRMFYAGSEPILLRRHPKNRRHLTVPVGLTIGIVWFILAATRGYWLLSGLIVFPVLVQFALAWRWARRTGIPIGTISLCLAILNRDLSALYLGAATISRYYAIPLVVVGLLLGLAWSPARWLVVLVVMSLCLTAAVDWWRLRPRLGPILFIAGHALDTVAYHVGILAACVRRGTLRPLLMDVGLVA